MRVFLAGHNGMVGSSILRKIKENKEDNTDRPPLFPGSWVPNAKILLTVVRYLGTTPTSSSVPTLVLSVCQQICYHMEVKKN